MNILDDNNSIRFGCFKCLDNNRVYTVTSTISTYVEDRKDSYNGKTYQKSYYNLDKALKAEDTIKRDDGESRKLMRSQLKSRFTNIEEYKQKPR